MPSDALAAGPDGRPRCFWAVGGAPEYLAYHDDEWGRPVLSDDGLYERLTLEAFQSGLSWLTILRKRPAFREAFAQFDPEAVSAFDDADVARLMTDAGIVRNRLKVDATIANARATVSLRDHGGLAEVVWSYKPDVTPTPMSWAEVPTQSPESVALAKRLKREGFRFVGPTTMYALMSAIGLVDTHLMGSHRRGCSGLWPE